VTGKPPQAISGRYPTAAIAVTSAILCASAIAAAATAFALAVSLLVAAVLVFAFWLALWSRNLRSRYRATDQCATEPKHVTIVWPSWVPILVKGYGIFLVIVFGLAFFLILAYVISRVT
jgi:hypothetical protein